MKTDTQTLLSIEDTMISRNYRLRVSNSDANTWFLHIDQAKLSDRGYYMCQVNTVPMLSRQGYLEVVGELGGGRGDGKGVRRGCVGLVLHCTIHMILPRL